MVSKIQQLIAPCFVVNIAIMRMRLLMQPDEVRINQMRLESTRTKLSKFDASVAENYIFILQTNKNISLRQRDMDRI